MTDEKILQSLRRIEGQVKGVQRMVSEKRPCDEVLMQIMAAKAALDRVTQDLVESHMDSCFDELPTEEIRSRMSKTISLLCKR